MTDIPRPTSHIDITPAQPDLPTTLASWLASGRRVAFACGGVDFAQFGPDDCAALYEIRNHPTVRPFMPSPDPLPYERHEAWVAAQLLTPGPASPFIVIGRDGGAPAAMGILKPRPEPGHLEMGVLVMGPWQRGTLTPLLGAAMYAIAARFFGAATLVTYVNRHNDAALRLNRGVGLVAMDTSDKPGEIMFRATLADLTSTPAFRRCASRLALRVDVPV